MKFASKPQRSACLPSKYTFYRYRYSVRNRKLNKTPFSASPLTPLSPSSPSPSWPMSTSLETATAQARLHLDLAVLGNQLLTWLKLFFEQTLLPSNDHGFLYILHFITTLLESILHYAEINSTNVNFRARTYVISLLNTKFVNFHADIWLRIDNPKRRKYAGIKTPFRTQ